LFPDNTIKDISTKIVAGSVILGATKFLHNYLLYKDDNIYNDNNTFYSKINAIIKYENELYETIKTWNGAYSINTSSNKCLNKNIFFMQHDQLQLYKDEDTEAKQTLLNNIIDAIEKKNITSIAELHKLLFDNTLLEAEEIKEDPKPERASYTKLAELNQFQLIHHKLSPSANQICNIRTLCHLIKKQYNPWSEKNIGTTIRHFASYITNLNLKLLPYTIMLLLILLDDTKTPDTLNKFFNKKS